MSMKPCKEIFAELCQHHNFSDKRSNFQSYSLHLLWGVFKYPWPSGPTFTSMAV